MSLKSIRESYTKLLDVFSGAGIALNESQKADLDTFVLALESKMSEQRKTAIRQTKKAVESKMEREYRKVFESVMAGMRENALLASKIQDKITKINESKKIANKVNEYLDLYVESVLPKKSIVDYDRMQKLEKIHESLKDVLLVSDDAVEAKKRELEESFKKQQSKCETEVAKLHMKLDEAIEKTKTMKRRINKYRAAELLESKVKDLPSYEARRVKNALEGRTSEEIESKFDSILESVRRHLNESKTEDVNTVESEIKKILDSDDVKEDDMLKGRKHNLHKDVDEADLSPEELEDIAGLTGNFYRDQRNMGGTSDGKTDLSTQADTQNKLSRSQNPEDFTANEAEDFETLEEVKTNNEGEIELDESDVIDRDLMRVWCDRSIILD